RQLRWIESTLFGTATLYYAGDTYSALFVDPAWLVEYAGRHPRELSILARQPSVIWMAMIVMYGTFIPNTGRRCAAVTFAMAVSLLAMIAFGGSRHLLVPPRDLFPCASDVSLWLAVDGVIGMCGANNIDVLTGEAVSS